MNQSTNKAYFKTLERHSNNIPLALDEVIQHLTLNKDGLIPIITQDVHSKQVLMFAWMNKESLALTIETKRMTYWSRSRQQLWKKGESSGHVQTLVDMCFDCDGDVILCQVEQLGAACHTGRPSCFYLQVDNEKQQVWVRGQHA